jgi:hypothetical protein
MQNSSTPAPNVASGTNSQNNTSTFQIPPLISLHFEELKREMTQFGQSFNDWVGEKRRILTDDKENYLKTLTEEAGKFIINYSIVFLINFIILRCCRGFEKAIRSITSKQIDNQPDH